MRLTQLLLVAATCAASCGLAHGSSIPSGQINQITVFGDSLSDAGNVSIATFGLLPGPGYATRSVPGIPFPVGYYTNPPSGSGPTGLWIDQLAGKIGVSDPVPVLSPFGGSNYAVGSATTGGALPQDMQNQVLLFLSTHLGGASASSLYTFWGGSDDIFNGNNPITAADNIAGQIQSIASAGGKDFLWLNLPNLGHVPELSGNSAGQAAASLASQAFDAEWLADVNHLDSLGINVIGVDLNTLFQQILADPSAFGFTNVTSACNVTAGCNPNTFLYWDELHPTTYADSLVATLAYDDAFGTSTAATPEPPSVMLLGAAALGLMLLGYRRRAMSL